MQKTIVVTGAAGFIGSNIIKGLNARGIDRIVAVDDLTHGDQFRNLADLKLHDYIDASEFYTRFANGDLGVNGSVDAIFHEGACSDTMESNGKFMMQNNYQTSLNLYRSCQTQGTRLLYASSAATYGNSTTFTEKPECELPLNVYGYSKLLFDQKMRTEVFHAQKSQQHQQNKQVVGFRYFNVYGNREQHKGRMASVAFHQFHQFQKDGFVQLFGDYNGYAAGEQQRDFVYIDDVVAVNLWFFDNPQQSGIFNLGTGKAQPFNDVALAVVNANVHSKARCLILSLSEAVAQKKIRYIDFPNALIGKYQCHTQADLTALRATGCNHVFSSVTDGVTQYMRLLQDAN